MKEMIVAKYKYRVPTMADEYRYFIIVEITNDGGIKLHEINKSRSAMVCSVKQFNKLFEFMEYIKVCLSDNYDNSDN